MKELHSSSQYDNVCVIVLIVVQYISLTMYKLQFIGNGQFSLLSAAPCRFLKLFFKLNKSINKGLWLGLLNEEKKKSRVNMKEYFNKCRRRRRRRRRLVINNKLYKWQRRR